MKVQKYDSVYSMWETIFSQQNKVGCGSNDFVDMVGVMV
jgi:hypothetical protein